MHTPPFRPSTRAPLTTLAYACVFALACTGSGGGGGGGVSAEVKSPYPRYSASTQATYVNTLPDGTTRTLRGEVVGEKTVSGKSYQRFAIAEAPGSGQGGIEAWGNLLGSDTVEFIGGEYTLTAGSTLDVPAYASATLDEPMMIALNPPVGTPQSFSLSGMAVVGDPNGTPEAATIEGTYTLAETDVSVETPTGLVSGCNHYELATELPGLFGEGMPVDADVYYHPQLGVVKAEVAEPLAGLGLGLSGTTDVSDLGNGLFSVQKLGTLGEGAGTSFALSTYEAHDDFDADKNVHAKMLMEVRWVDDAMAKTSQMPFVNQEFGTTFGYFPSSFVESPVSYFFPEEQGYKHWIAFVDQAAKNQSINGIEYRISASYEPDFSPVRVAARIVYTRYAPGAATTPHGEVDGGG